MSQTPDPNEDIPYADARPTAGTQKYPQYNQPQYAGGQMQPPPQNATGTTGFIVSLVSLFLCGIPSLIGIIISAMGLRKEPQGLAIAGLILGLLGVVECIAFVLFSIAAYTTVQTAGIAFQTITTKITVEQEAMEVFESWEKNDSVPSQEEGDEIIFGKADSMGNPILYETDGESFTIRSTGPDGIANNEDDITAGPYSDLSEYEKLKDGPFNIENIDIENMDLDDMDLENMDLDGDGTETE